MLLAPVAALLGGVEGQSWAVPYSSKCIQDPADFVLISWRAFPLPTGPEAPSLPKLSLFTGTSFAAWLSRWPELPLSPTQEPVS